MTRIVTMAGVLAATLVASACAQVLGYDDYRAREAAQPTFVDTGAPLDAESVGDEVADAGEVPHRAPTRPAGDAVPSGAGRTLWLAFKRYRLGAVDPTGVSDENAWRAHGYDLDSLCTSPRDSIENVGTCRRPAGAQQDSLMDGDGCRDNNFGRFVGAMLRGAAPDSEKMLDGYIDAGSSTWLLRIDDVDMGADDTYAPATLYRLNDERPNETKVKWDGTDVRAVHSDTVIDGDINRGVTTFPRGFVRNGTWVSGEPAPLDASVPVTATIFVQMKLAHAQLTLELNAERTTGHNGVITGVLAASDVEPILKPIADNAGVCPGTSLYASLIASIAKMPDVSLGVPTLQDPSATCDGVSAGMGFEVLPIQPVTEVVPPPALRQPRCADAG